MNILVTGGAGYIGSHVVKDLLLNKNNNIIIVDNLSTGTVSSVLGAKLIVLDLLDEVSLEKVFRKYNFDIIMHFAASIIVSESIENPLDYYTNNSFTTLVLLKLANKYKVSKFIFSSTAAIYGESLSKMVSESEKLLPINPYGMSKLFSEKMIIDNAKVNKNFKFCILRYFNVAGADIGGIIGQSKKEGTHLIKVACQTALGEREFLKIFGNTYNTKDGTCIRDYIHINDLSEAHIKAISYLENNKSEIFNCGYGEGYSVLEVINMIKKISAVDFDVKIVENRKGDVPILIANKKK